jgi:transposase-like protein
MNSARSVIKRLRFPLDIMLLCVRWYVAYPLSLRTPVISPHAIVRTGRES